MEKNMAFNLKKTMAENKKVILPYEKMLQQNNEEMGIEPITDPTNYTNLLEEDRKHPEGDEILEKQLAKKKVAQRITEKELNTRKSYIPHRSNDGLPLADMPLEKELEDAKQFAQANKEEKRDTEFWDEYVGTQINADQITTVVGNNQPSQLISNFETREDFRKENPSMKMANTVEAIKDSDAMLYHIYRNAAEKNKQNSEK
jgi:hypothetical protein